MWQLRVARVPSEKEDEIRCGQASMVGADTFDDDLTDLDWDGLDEESWKKASAHKQDSGIYPDNWWESKQYYDAEYTLPMPDKDGLDL